jgi:hypothetical protein
LENCKFREDIIDLPKMENDIRKTMLAAFEAEINDVMKSVELGNLLKGRCRFCL